MSKELLIHHFNDVVRDFIYASVVTAESDSSVSHRRCRTRRPFCTCLQTIPTFTLHFADDQQRQNIQWRCLLAINRSVHHARRTHGPGPERTGHRHRLLRQPRFGFLVPRVGTQTETRVKISTSVRPDLKRSRTRLPFRGCSRMRSGTQQTLPAHRTLANPYSRARTSTSFVTWQDTRLVSSVSQERKSARETTLDFVSFATTLYAW